MSSRWVVGSFDHRSTLAAVPEYADAVAAIDRLASALSRAGVECTQEDLAVGLASATRAIVYADSCERCDRAARTSEDRYRAHHPVAVIVEGDGLIGVYRCAVCGHEWTCSWSVDAPLLAP